MTIKEFIDIVKEKQEKEKEFNRQYNCDEVDDIMNYDIFINEEGFCSLLEFDSFDGYNQTILLKKFCKNT